MSKKQQNPPRPDGLTVEEIEGIERWLAAIRREMVLLGAALGLGQYQALPGGDTAAGHIEAIRRLAVDGPEGNDGR